MLRAFLSYLGIQLEPATDPPIRVGHERIRQALGHLVVNALHTPAGREAWAESLKAKRMTLSIRLGVL